MSVDPRAGKPPTEEMLADLSKLEHAYYEEHPDPSRSSERVAFGTSGHRGSSIRRSFNEDHIVAITEAICDFREENGIFGPLYLGMDTHALSVPAHSTAVEVLGARGVRVLVAPGGAYTPTPAVSRAIVTHNRDAGARADGIVITPSHNPPEDGGFKYNPPHGGPAESAITSWIERRANDRLARAREQGPRRPAGKAPPTVETYDFATRYVEDLKEAIDLEAIARVRPKLGVDPLGGASVEYWGRIGQRYGLDLTVVNRTVDKTFRFVPVDHDGRIRTDCSSPYAMANVLAQRSHFDVALANDGDADRHGIVTPKAGLLPPNHYLCVAIDYLLQHRPAWPSAAAVAMTAVSSDLIRRVAERLGRRVVEVPVGFKWFVPGLHERTLCFGGEESAGASLLARDGSTWTTDKDGILLALLAAEIVSVTGTDPAAYYARIDQALGPSFYERRDAPASAATRDRLRALRADDWSAPLLAGDSVRSRRTAAGNGADLGGLKVTTDHGWFAVRPSGTEDVYKVYAESFRSADHLQAIIGEAIAGVGALLGQCPCLS